jgi:hypothetical protein
MRLLYSWVRLKTFQHKTFEGHVKGCSSVRSFLSLVFYLFKIFETNAQNIVFIVSVPIFYIILKLVLISLCSRTTLGFGPPC